MKIVFAGNCQAYAYSFVYERNIASAMEQRVGWIDVWNEHRIADWQAELADADLVVSQVFSSRPRVPIDDWCHDIPQVRVPDVRGSFLWPYGNVPRVDNPVTWFKGGGPYDPEVGDSFLNRLIKDGISPEEALARYRALDIARETGLDRLFELTLDQQRARDAASGFAVADHVERHFRSDRLFNTQGHMSIGLFLRVAAELFRRIGAAEELIARMRERETVAPFELCHDAPIHPGVIAHYGLTCVDENTRYHHVQEDAFTFSEWVPRYMRNMWSPSLHEGRVVAAQGDPHRALALLDEGLAAAARSAHGHSARADVLETLGRLEEAAAAAERAWTLQPDHTHFADRLRQLRASLVTPV